MRYKFLSFVIAFLFFGVFIFQSCLPENSVKPMNPSNLVTAKIVNSASDDFPHQSPKHLLIVSMDESQHIVLDTNIVGSINYSFYSKSSTLKVTVTVHSATAFVGSIEIDANGKMQANNQSPCAGTDLDLVDNISF
jgi:hypothetical protein